MLLIVEGTNDAAFLSQLSMILARGDPAVADLSVLTAHGHVVPVPFCGGSPIWTQQLSALGCRELHVYDREKEPETSLRLAAARTVNRRSHCRAFVTRHRSIEHYISPVAIRNAGGPEIQFVHEECVATKLATAWHPKDAATPSWHSLEKSVRLKRTQRAKRWLNLKAVKFMSAELLAESDPHGDITHWLRTLQEMVRSR